MSKYIEYPIPNPRQPTACAYCGISPRNHFQRWTSAAGWHEWRMPSQRKILMRMLARKGNPNRWIAATDRRTTYRKWGA
jgi:hypothetical protein